MKRYIFYIFILISLLFASCTNDIPTHNSALGKYNLSLKVAISSSGQPSTRGYGVTRATEPGDMSADFNENDINRVDVFFYQGENLIWYPENVFYEPVHGKVGINVPTAQESLFDGTKQYDIYIIVNGPARAEMENKTLTQLRNTVLTTDFSVTNRIATQPEFVMDGFVTGKFVSLTTPDLGTIDVKRAVAKLRVRILKGPVIDSYLDGTTGATPLVSARNYNEQGALMQNNTIFPLSLQSDAADFTPANSVINEGDYPGSKTPYPIYSYPNDWSTDRTKETYVMIRVPLKTIDSNLDGIYDTFRYYYYKVPVNFQKPEGPQSEAEKIFYQIDRNFIYDVEVYINQLGSTDNDPSVTLTGNYTILDWNQQPVSINITQDHYLFVKPQSGDMVNTTSYVLDFSSSQLPISISNIKTSYTYRNTTGDSITVNYQAGSVQTGTPSVSTDGSVRIYIDQPTTGKITVTSAIPTNEVPKDISFTVSNGITKLDQTIHIRQLPQYYITSLLGVSSILRVDGTLLAGYTNESLYTLTDLSPSGTTIIGFPPRDMTNTYTENSLEVANMMAPSFTVASELGAYPETSYANALTICADYWEETFINGVRMHYDDWRLPTEAELQFIYERQTATSGVVKNILVNNYYWDAYGANGAYQMTGGTGTGTSTNAYVRCVRDVKN